MANFGSAGQLLSGLYYPFSRCADPSSTKQMLLVLDSVHFVDPVDDDQWRAQLMTDMEKAGFPEFGKYRSINEALPTLIREGAVVRHDPAALSATTDDTVVAAALTNLEDKSWAMTAASPGAFQRPHHRAPDGAPTWEIFKPKLPDTFVRALSSTSHLRRHIVDRGEGDQSWMLSYEAGSAITLSVHLRAAEELGLAPVTDSELHHVLLLQQVARAHDGSTERDGPLPAEVVRHLASKVAVTILEGLLPRRDLEKISFDEILEFRTQTAVLRRQCVSELQSSLSLVAKHPAALQFEQAATELRLALEKDLREYRAELVSVRDKVWPAFTGALGTGVPQAGLAALTATYLGGPGLALSAAGLSVGFTLLKKALGLKNEEKRLAARLAPTVSYFSRVADFAR